MAFLIQPVRVFTLVIEVDPGQGQARRVTLCEDGKVGIPGQCFNETPVMIRKRIAHQQYLRRGLHGA
ncbi:hypothetical protein D3C78_1718380 [compost metagenome]